MGGVCGIAQLTYPESSLDDRPGDYPESNLDLGYSTFYLLLTCVVRLPASL